ncbi:MAG: TonB C-terminal domain-containing protein [Deltaproteobacteria bacterium]|jgi:outer membrane biosynthesis protein TonB|nr:TonB C-terminal domain-containing protein [Deltaproteobacteria bacterium]
MSASPYDAQTRTSDSAVMGVIAGSLVIHFLIYWAMVLAPDFFGRPQELPFDAITVQLVGSVEPPAPAAPAAPVNPDLQVPDVVKLPTAPPVIPQPTPLEDLVIPQTPPEVIPIGRTPVEPPPPVQKAKDPPPKVKPPEKPPEPQPKPKPKPRAPSDQQRLNESIRELERKKALREEEQALNQSIANIAAERGRGNGLSSEPAAPNNQGQRIDPEKQRYYLQLMEIVRSNWMPPASAVSASNISTTFVIAIDPSGRITGKNLRVSSGNTDYDSSVEMAINRSRFPPLPPAFGGKPDNPALKFNLSYLRAG